MLKVFQHHIPVSTIAELLADGLFAFFAILLASRGLLSGQAIAVQSFGELLGPAAGFAAVMLLLYSMVGLYSRGAISVGLTSLLGRAAIAIVMGSVIAYGALRIEGSSSVVGIELLFQAVAYLALGLVTVRVVVHATRASAMGAPRVLIVGTGEDARSVAADLRTPGRAHRNIVGFYPAGSEGVVVGEGARVFGTELTIDELARKFNVDEVIVAVREQRGGNVPMEQLLACRVRGVSVLDLAGIYERARGEVPTESLKASWLIYGNGFVQGPVRTAVKRCFDIVSSLMLLVLASPIMLLTVIAIRLESKGPIIYSQERVGFGGRSFNCLKFRSMRTDAEKDGVARWASKNDSRITRVGAFIRKTRIDELPQLVSVLRGEMSMVGPRPERPWFVGQLKEQIPFYDIRHSVKPGVTGWAQVRYSYGASVEDARRKHQFDLYYVKNNSLFLDLLILVETVRVVLFREGAQ